MPDLDLFAVQALVSPHTYRHERHFRAHARSLLDRVDALRSFAGGSEGIPAVVVFPENYGTFLALTALGGFAASLPTIESAMALGLLSRPRGFLGNLRRTGWRDAARAALLTVADDVKAIYRDTFSDLAQRYEVTLVAGSAAIDDDDGGVFNTCLIFDEAGREVARVKKANLVPEIEDDIGLSPAPDAPFGTPIDADDTWPGQATPIAKTAAGTIGALICYDGFAVPHTQNEPHFRAAGANFATDAVRVLAHPSANPWPWEEAWVHASPSAPMLRREQWRREGLKARLEGLPSIPYGITAHLVGDVLDQRFEGTSEIFARSEDDTIAPVASAPRHDIQWVVHARVSAPWLA